MMRSRQAILVTIATGVAIELVIHALSGRREAWDSPLYFVVGLPVALAVSFAIGLRSIGSAWAWTALIIPSQVMTMMVRSGEIGGLWPLTLVFTSILSGPFVVAAFGGSRLRRPK